MLCLSGGTFSRWREAITVREGGSPRSARWLGGRFVGKLSLRNQVGLVVQYPGRTCYVPHPGKWVRVVRRRGEAVKGVGGGSEEGMVSRVSAPRPPLCQVTSLLDLVSSAKPSVLRWLAR